MEHRPRLHRLGAYLGLNRNILAMTFANAFKRFGTGLWNEYVPKVLETLGANGPMIGLFGTINSGFAALYAYFGGAISDRLGRGNVLIVSALVALAGYFIYAVSPLWWLFIPGSVLLTASAWFEFMGSLALVGESVEGKRRAVSLASFDLIPLPFALAGPPIGGLLIASLGVIGGFRLGVWTTIGLTVAAIVLQRRMYRLPPPVSTRLAMDVRAAWRELPPDLRKMLLANSVQAFGAGLAQIFVVLYAMNVMGVSALGFGALHATMLAASSLSAVPVGKLADRRIGSSRRPFVALSFLLMALYPLLMVLAPSAGWLWPIFVLRGIRQSFDGVRKAMIVDLAGEGQRGRIIGFYFFVVGLVGFPSAFIAGWLYSWRVEAPFVASTVVGLLSVLIFLITTRRR